MDQLGQAGVLLASLFGSSCSPEISDPHERVEFYLERSARIFVGKVVDQTIEYEERAPGVKIEKRQIARLRVTEAFKGTNESEVVEVGTWLDSYGSYKVFEGYEYLVFLSPPPGIGGINACGQIVAAEKATVERQLLRDMRPRGQ
ncbi:MAG: hypothetical protein AAF358_11660 [Pseudomonadota bacterium]